MNNGAGRGRGAKIKVQSSKLKGNSKAQDRKSTRLNSSHLVISYAVFCLKKKNKEGVAHAYPAARPRERRAGLLRDAALPHTLLFIRLPAGSRPVLDRDRVVERGH